MLAAFIALCFKTFNDKLHLSSSGNVTELLTASWQQAGIPLPTKCNLKPQVIQHTCASLQIAGMLTLVLVFFCQLRCSEFPVYFIIKYG